MSEYDFEIKHIKGKENQVDDAINRRDCEMHITTISMYMTDLKSKIIATTNLDQQDLQVKETLQHSDFQQKINYYALQEDGIFMYKGKVYVPNSSELKNTAMREMHNVLYVGHPRY
jgi:hypothetical protein